VCFGEACVKPGFSLLRPPPVTGSHSRPVDPNFADLFRSTTPERFGIDNLDFRIESLVSTTDERACVVLLGHSFDNTMLFESMGADSANNWRFCAAAARHFQSRFRQAICRIERFPAKAALTKLVCTAPQCFKAHRLP